MFENSSKFGVWRRMPAASRRLRRSTSGRCRGSSRCGAVAQWRWTLRVHRLCLCGEAAWECRAGSTCVSMISGP